MGTEIDFWGRVGYTERSILEELRLELVDNQRMMNETDDVVDLDALWEARRSIINKIHKIQEEQGDKDIEKKRLREKIKFAHAWLHRHFDTHPNNLDALHKYEKLVDLFVEKYNERPT